MTRLPLAPLAELPLVSVVIPAYQAQDYVGHAIDSVRASTYSQWQCVVIDDGSTDNTAERISRHAAGDPRVTVVRKANAGPLSCLNAAAAIVQGQVVCLLDADDLMMPNKLATIVNALRAHPRAGLAVHRLAVCDRNLRMLGLSPVRRSLPHGDRTETVLRSRRGVPGLGVSSGFSLRSEVYRALFPAGFTTRRFPDEYIRRCAPLVTDLCAVDLVLGIRRIHGQNLTGGQRSYEDEVHRSREDHSQLATALSAFATRHGFGGDLAPDAEDVDLLLLDWIIARLSGDGEPQEAWRRLTHARGYGTLPLPFRSYWRLAHRAPRPLFRWLMSSASRSDRVRLLANYLAIGRRTRSLESLPRRVSLPTVVQFALGRPRSAPQATPRRT